MTPVVTGVRMTGAAPPRGAAAAGARTLARHRAGALWTDVRRPPGRRLRRARLGPARPRPQPVRAERAVHDGRARRGRAGARRRRPGAARRRRVRRSPTPATRSAAPSGCSCCSTIPTGSTPPRCSAPARRSATPTAGPTRVEPGHGVRARPAMVAASAERWFAAGFLEREPGPGQRPAARAARRRRRRATSRSARRSRPSTSATGSPRSRQPVLAVAGAQDHVDPAGAARSEIADGVKDGRLVVLDDVAHLAPAERPDDVARLHPPSTCGASLDEPDDTVASARGRDGRPPRGARRRARRPVAGGSHRPDPRLPGLHHDLRLGRDLDPPRPRPAQPLDDHAHRAGRARPPRGAGDAPARRPHATA